MSKRVDQKAAARVVREQIARENRQKRVIWTSIAVVLAVLVAGGIGFGIWQAQQPETFNVPATATAEQDGMVVANTSGKAKVEFYIDYQCPACNQFEEMVTSEVDQWVKDNKITLIYHPVAILDQMSSGTKYSTRASAAAACAADGGKLYEFNKALFAQQPQEGGTGLTDDQIIAVGASAGLTDPAFASCVRDGKYKTWSKKITDDFTKRGGTGTPTVYVNGEELARDQMNVDGLKKAVEAAQQ